MKKWTVAILASIVVSTVAAFSFDEKSAQSAAGEKSLEDFQHFRIATIDLVGRMPTRDEVAAFEKPTFDFDKFVDEHLQGPGYTERLTRIYMDLLRLEPNLNFSTSPAQLYRHDFELEDGKPVQIYFREGQRRARPETDGEFCLSTDETGVVIRLRAQTLGTPKKISKKLLEKYTVIVKPWWLYKDYDAPKPNERYGVNFSNADPEYRPVESLLTEPDGKTPTTEIRICREEAQESDTGHIYASGRVKALPKDAKLPGGRIRPLVLDSAFATQHKGEAVACDTKLATSSAIDCGCGKGLSRCIPGDNDGTPNAFYFPNHTPLGEADPLDFNKQQAQRWIPHWWSREAVHYIEDIFESDRDFREILTGKHTFVNGPLAQFYKSIQRGGCCGPEANFGMTEESEPLFDPKNVPADLRPHDVGTWKLVADRGPHAAGILTTPMFLEKYASARARGALLYNAFLCKSFIADNSTQLTPSSEPNLMIRPGCSTCHATLEPLAAYFARVEPANFVFLPGAQFPVHSDKCKKDKNGKLNGACNALYDVAFVDNSGATLRSAYASPIHADAEPKGAATDITKSPEFAACAVDRVTSSFLGRQTTSDDAVLLQSLTGEFVKSGFKMRTLVKSIMRSPAYRKSNNLSGDAWRQEHGQKASLPGSPAPLPSAGQAAHGGM